MTLDVMRGTLSTSNDYIWKLNLEHSQRLGDEFFIVTTESLDYVSPFNTSSTVIPSKISLAICMLSTLELDIALDT